MALRRAYLRDSELDRTSYPEFRDQVIAFDQSPHTHVPRSYPGYPQVPLVRVRPRTLCRLEAALGARRSRRRLGHQIPPLGTLSRLLQYAHGAASPDGRGPVPSAGGLQAVELYLAPLETGWLEGGLYHYDRAGHHLSQVGPGAPRGTWETLIPSMALVEGGAVLWIIVGDTARMGAKYGDRGGRFLLLEAGHLMQNLCLLSSSLKLSTVPLGAALEPEIARQIGLASGDAVLYAGLCGGL